MTIEQILEGKEGENMQITRVRMFADRGKNIYKTDTVFKKRADQQTLLRAEATWSLNN